MYSTLLKLQNLNNILLKYLVSSQSLDQNHSSGPLTATLRSTVPTFLLRFSNVFGLLEMQISEFHKTFMDYKNANKKVMADKVGSIKKKKMLFCHVCLNLFSPQIILLRSITGFFWHIHGVIFICKRMKFKSMTIEAFKIENIF